MACARSQPGGSGAAVMSTSWVRAAAHPSSGACESMPCRLSARNYSVPDQPALLFVCPALMRSSLWQVQAFPWTPAAVLRPQTVVTAVLSLGSFNSSPLPGVWPLNQRLSIQPPPISVGKQTSISGWGGGRWVLLALTSVQNSLHFALCIPSCRTLF